MVRRKGTEVRLDETRWFAHDIVGGWRQGGGIVLALMAPNRWQAWLVCYAVKAIRTTPCPLRADEPLHL